MLATLIVSTNADSGPGSLRDAINQVNTARSTALTTIDFAIGTGGLQTIALRSALPKISYPVLIDGSSQPGGSTTPRIEINGASAGGGVVGLDLVGGNSTVQGLVVDGFGPSSNPSPRPIGIGIRLETVFSGDVVRGNFIGTDPTGTAASAGNEVGVEVDDAYQQYTAIVGGTTVADRNIISGNGTGVVLTSGTVEGNFIGTDLTGTVVLPNTTGIKVLYTLLGNPPSGTAQGTIGGNVAGSGNLISGNSGSGIAFTNGRNFLTRGNTIGLGSDGRALGNGGDGITFFPVISDGGQSILTISYNDPIGGPEAGSGNTIADNNGAGVGIQESVSNTTFSPTSVAIRGNAIFGNGRLGIDLGDDGVSANSSQGPSGVGPNFFQAHPVLTSVTNSGGSTTVNGTFDDAPNSSYPIDLYGNATADPSGFGQGQQYLTSITVITDGNGHKQFSTTFPTPSGLPFITATATDPVYNDTSEFSEAAATTSTPLVSDVSVRGSASTNRARIGDSVVFTYLVTNNGPNPAVGTTLFEKFDQTLGSGFAASKYVVGPTDVTTSVLALGRISLGTIAPGKSVTVQITYSSRTGSHPFNGSTGTDTDTVLATTATSDPNLSNNQVSLSFTRLADPYARLSLATTPLSGTFRQGVPVTITIRATNVGDADASGVVVGETPPGVVDSFQASQGTSALISGTVEFSLGTIAPGATATMTVVITPTVPGLQNNSGGVQTFSTVGIVLNGFYSGTANFGLLVLPRDVRADFEGTGKADIAEFIPSTATFAIRPSTGGPDKIIQFGIPGVGQSIPATGDYDGDGKTDLAVYLPSIGAFAIRPSSGGPDQIIPFGIAGAGQSIPAPGDYDGDGKTDLAVYLPSVGAFAYRPSSGGPDRIIPFGLAGAGQSIPAPGDYNGDGTTDLAVYLPALGVYAYRPSGGGADRLIQFGAAGAGQSIPAPGDYDGDGKTDLAVYLPRFGLFAVRPSSGGGDRLGTFGTSGAGQTLPAPGDYNGDGITDVAASLPAFGLFAVRPSSGGGDRVGTFGPIGLGQSVPVSGLASLTVSASGVSSLSVPAASKVTSQSASHGLVTPGGPTRKMALGPKGSHRPYRHSGIGLA